MEYTERTHAAMRACVLALADLGNAKALEAGPADSEYIARCKANARAALRQLEYADGAHFQQ